LKSTHNEIRGGKRPSHFQSFYHYNSAADCSISLTFRRKFDHAIMYTTSVQGHKIRVNVTKW